MLPLYIALSVAVTFSSTLSRYILHILCYIYQGLLACACDDGVVRVLNSSSRQCVRRLGPCSFPSPSVNDLCFTPDCRRLVTATSNG